MDAGTVKVKMRVQGTDAIVALLRGTEELVGAMASVRAALVANGAFEDLVVEMDEAFVAYGRVTRATKRSLLARERDRG